MLKQKGNFQNYPLTWENVQRGERHVENKL
jgi:hypothetical protein